MPLPYQELYNRQVIERGEAYNVAALDYLDVHFKSIVVSAMDECLKVRPSSPVRFIAEHIKHAQNEQMQYIKTASKMDAHGEVPSSSHVETQRASTQECFTLEIDRMLTCEVQSLSRYSSRAESLRGLPVSKMMSPNVYEVDVALRHLEANAARNSDTIRPSPLLFIVEPPAAPWELFFLQGIPYLSNLSQQLQQLPHKKRQEQLRRAHCPEEDLCSARICATQLSTNEVLDGHETVSKQIAAVLPDSHESFAVRALQLLREKLGSDVQSLEVAMGALCDKLHGMVGSTVGGDGGVEEVTYVAPTIQLVVLPAVPRSFFEVFDRIDAGFRAVMHCTKEGDTEISQSDAAAAAAACKPLLAVCGGGTMACAGKDSATLGACTPWPYSNVRAANKEDNVAQTGSSKCMGSCDACSPRTGADSVAVRMTGSYIEPPSVLFVSYRRERDAAALTFARVLAAFLPYQEQSQRVKLAMMRAERVRAIESVGARYIRQYWAEVQQRRAARDNRRRLKAVCVTPVTATTGSSSEEAPLATRDDCEAATKNEEGNNDTRNGTSVHGMNSTPPHAVHPLAPAQRAIEKAPQPSTRIGMHSSTTGSSSSSSNGIRKSMDRQQTQTNSLTECSREQAVAQRRARRANEDAGYVAALRELECAAATRIQAYLRGMRARRGGAAARRPRSRLSRRLRSTISASQTSRNSLSSSTVISTRAVRTGDRANEDNKAVVRTVTTPEQGLDSTQSRTSTPTATTDSTFATVASPTLSIATAAGKRVIATPVPASTNEVSPCSAYAAVECLLHPLSPNVPPLLRLCLARLTVVHGRFFGNYAATGLPQPRCVARYIPIRRRLTSASPSSAWPAACSTVGSSLTATATSAQDAASDNTSCPDAASGTGHVRTTPSTKASMQKNGYKSHTRAPNSLRTHPHPDTDEEKSESETWVRQEWLIPPRRSARPRQRFNVLRRLLECHTLAGCDLLDAAMTMQRGCGGLSRLQRTAYDMLRSLALSMLHIAYTELYHQRRWDQSGLAGHTRTQNSTSSSSSGSSNSGTFSEYVMHHHPDLLGLLAHPHDTSLRVQCALQRNESAGRGWDKDGLWSVPLPPQTFSRASAGAGALCGYRREHVLLPRSLYCVPHGTHPVSASIQSDCAACTNAIDTEDTPARVWAATRLVYLTPALLTRDERVRVLRRVAHDYQAGETALRRPISLSQGTLEEHGRSSMLPRRPGRAEVPRHTPNSMRDTDENSSNNDRVYSTVSKRNDEVVNAPVVWYWDVCPHPMVYVSDGVPLALLPRHNGPQEVDGQADYATYQVCIDAVGDSTTHPSATNESATAAGQRANVAPDSNLNMDHPDAHDATTATMKQVDTDELFVQAESIVSCHNAQIRLPTWTTDETALCEELTNEARTTGGWLQFHVADYLGQRDTTSAHDEPTQHCSSRRSTQDCSTDDGVSVLRNSKEGAVGAERTEHNQRGSDDRGPRARYRADCHAPHLRQVQCCCLTHSDCNATPHKDNSRRNGTTRDTTKVQSAAEDKKLSIATPSTTMASCCAASPSLRVVHLRPQLFRATATVGDMSVYENFLNLCMAQLRRNHVLIVSAERGADEQLLYGASLILLARVVEGWGRADGPVSMNTTAAATVPSYTLAGSNAVDTVVHVDWSNHPHFLQDYYARLESLATSNGEFALRGNDAHARNFVSEAVRATSALIREVEGGAESHNPSSQTSREHGISSSRKRSIGQSLMDADICPGAEKESVGLSFAHEMRAAEAMHDGVRAIPNEDSTAMLHTRNGAGCAWEEGDAHVSSACRQRILMLVRRAETYCILLALCCFCTTPCHAEALRIGGCRPLSRFVAFFTQSGLRQWVMEMDPWAECPGLCPDVTHTRYTHGLRRWDEDRYIRFAAW